jgi:hypothetical protein
LHQTESYKELISTSVALTKSITGLLKAYCYTSFQGIVLNGAAVAPTSKVREIIMLSAPIVGNYELSVWSDLY